MDSTSLPSSFDIESFYKMQLISRSINAQWRYVILIDSTPYGEALTLLRTQKVYVTFMNTGNPYDTSGPNQTRYYSNQDGGVYYTYL